MDRVSAEISKEVCVLFQDDYFYAGASEKKPQHHPCRSPARNTAADSQLFGHFSMKAHHYYLIPLSGLNLPIGNSQI